jgi:hypothetical protein
MIIRVAEWIAAGPDDISPSVAGFNEVLGVSLILGRSDHETFCQCVCSALLITGSMFLQPAHAQSAPEGSYRKSCTDARVEDRTLTAVCRIADGREQSTSLTDVNR